MQVLTTDVAIVGGGAAGCYAALNLHRAGLKTVIVCKGLVGKSGASIFAGNLVLGGRLLGNTEDNAKNTAEFLVKYHNQFLIDQNWARRCGQWIENVYYPELEEAGLYFRRDDDGNVVSSPGKIRSIAANVQGNSGVPFMDLRRKQIVRAGIPTLEETAVTALLCRPDGSVGGVFALNTITGAYIVAVSLHFNPILQLFWIFTITFMASYRSFRINGVAIAPRRTFIFALFVAQVVTFLAWAITALSIYLVVNEGTFAVMLLFAWYINRGLVRHTVEESFTRNVVLEYGAFAVVLVYLFVASYQPGR